MSTGMIDASARIEAGAAIGRNVSIGPYCTIGPHVTVGDDCRLLAHVNLSRVMVRPTSRCGSKMSKLVVLKSKAQRVTHNLLLDILSLE